MHTNSLSAWNIKLPTLTASQRAVYIALKELGRGDSKQVADHMHIELHKISGRFKEMKDKGWIEELPSVNGRAVWTVKEGKPQQLSMFSTRDY